MLAGTLSPDLSSLTLDTTTQLTIGVQSDIGNMSDETLLLADDSLLTIYEANGAEVNEMPVAHVFNRDLTQSKTTSFPNIEYRTTNATALDANNRFWVINYYFPNEGVLLPDVDPIAELYGQGITHKQYDHVERLIELEYSESGIQLVERPPIQLELIDAPRNWEGIVRLDNRGFLIVTDKWSESILGFVAK